MVFLSLTLLHQTRIDRSTPFAMPLFMWSLPPRMPSPYLHMPRVSSSFKAQLKSHLFFKALSGPPNRSDFCIAASGALSLREAPPLYCRIYSHILSPISHSEPQGWIHTGPSLNPPHHLPQSFPHGGCLTEETREGGGPRSPWNFSR